MSPQPGEVWLADLTPNQRSRYEVPFAKLPFLDHVSVANVQGLGSLPAVRLERRLGKLPAEVMVKIKNALVFALELQADS